MLFNHRVLVRSNNVLIDISRFVCGMSGAVGQFDYVTATDYIYIGADLPFTSRFFLLGAVVNAEDAVASVEIWDGNAWVAAVDVIDFTSGNNDKSLSQNGVLSWSTDRNKSWSAEESTENMAGSGLETLKIYGLYWIRIKFDADLTAGLELDYVGHRFSNDEDLAMRYPDLMLSASKEAFAAGKTNWNDQHILAAEEVVRYLQRHHELWSPNQILNWQRFTQAAVHKCAEIAYSGFSGDDMEVLRARAEKNFRIALNQGVMDIDRNQDGHVQRVERGPNAGITRA